MRQKYNVKITTLKKSYTFEWTMKVQTLNSHEHPADNFFMHDNFVVNEDGKGDTIVPRHAILEVKFTPIKDY